LTVSLAHGRLESLLTKEELVGRTWASLSGTVAIQPLDPQTQLALASHVRVERAAGVVRKLDLGGRVAGLDPESGQMVGSLLDQLDGRTTLADAARALDWDVADVVDAAQDLYHLAALENVGDTTIPAVPFFKHVSALGRSVQARIAEDAESLFANMMTGKPTRRLLLGYLVEFYHIVIRASQHISPSINHAPNLRLRMLLSEYLGDEYWHGLWLRKGLRQAGLTDQQIDASDPLPATLGAIDRLRAESSSDLLAYAACISTGEGAGESEIERLQNRYGALAKHGLFPEGVIEPFRDHEIADCSLGHFSFCAEMYAEAPPIGRQHQDTIRRAMLAYLRCLEEQHHQIARFYGTDEDGPPVFTGGWTPPAPVGRDNTNLTPDEVAARLGEANFYIYDCGSLDTYRTSHVPGAIWVDPAAITLRALPLDPLATLVFYCVDETCPSCDRGATRAKQLGYRNVFVMRAGIAGWRSGSRTIARAG
jgi:hypothetical protein